MSVTKIVPLTNVGLLSAAIARTHNRPAGLPGLVVMYGASGLGKSVGAAFAANQHRAYYVECRDTWSKKAFLHAILREMSIQPAPTMSVMVDQIAEQLSKSGRPLLIDDVQYLLEKAVANVLTDIYDRDVYHYRTKHQGEDYVQGPYIVMLAALTTEISQQLQTSRILSTGLSRRAFFQYGERDWYNPHPKPEMTPTEIAARDRAVAHLNAIRNINSKAFIVLTHF